MLKYIISLILVISSFMGIYAQTFKVTYAYIDEESGKRTSGEPFYIEPTGDKYILDMDNLCYIHLFFYSETETFNGYHRAKYCFHVKPEELGTRFAPIDASTQAWSSKLAWPGDYHIEIARDMSWAVFTTTTPFFKEYHNIYANIERGNHVKTPLFKKLGDYKFSYDFIGDDKLEKGDEIFFSVVGRPNFFGEMSSGGIFLEPGEKYDIHNLKYRTPYYQWVFNANEQRPIVETYDDVLAEDFEGTIVVQAYPDYWTPFEIELIPLETTGVNEIEVSEKANQGTRYYNLQGVEVNEPAGGIFIEVTGDTSRLVRK